MDKVSRVLACLGGASRVCGVNSGAKILLPETKDERVLKAADYVTANDLARVELVHEIPSDPEFLSPYVEAYLASSPNLNESQAAERLQDPLRFANLKVKLNQASGVVAGCQRTTEDVVKAALEFLRIPNCRVSSFFLMIKDGNPFAFTDCGMNIAPTADQLANIAIQTSNSFRQLTAYEFPKVAFLSFSTCGSSNHDSLNYIREAMEMARVTDSASLYDGELQFDAALVPEVAAKKSPQSVVAGEADILVFPDLNSGNIAYKIAERWGGAVAIGPILQGLSAPSNDLSRGCDFQDIVNMIIVTKLLSSASSSSSSPSTDIFGNDPAAATAAAAATVVGGRHRLPRSKGGLVQRIPHWKNKLKTSRRE